MGKRILNLVMDGVSGTRVAVFYLTGFAFLTQLVALVRDRLLVHIFGVGKDLDIYYAAFKIPDLIFVVVASVVSVYALIPLMARYEGDRELLMRGLRSVFTVFIYLVLAVSIVVFIWMPELTSFFYSGFDAMAIEQTIFLSRVMLLSAVFLGLSNFYGSILQYHDKFIAGCIAPLTYNLSIALCTAIFYRSFGVTSAVIGVAVGALLHCLIHASIVYRSRETSGRYFLFNIGRVDWSQVFCVSKVALPRVLSVFSITLIPFAYASLASHLVSGSISVVNFASTLGGVPLTLIGVSFSTALFPVLSRSFAGREHAKFYSKLVQGLLAIICIAGLATIIIFLFRNLIVGLLLQSGHFSASDTALTGAALAIYSLSCVSSCLLLYLSRIHYSIGRNLWPFVGNFASAIISIGMAYFSIVYFDIFDPFFRSIAVVLRVETLYYQVLTIPLSFSIGSIVGAVVLFLGLGREHLRSILKYLHT